MTTEKRGPALKTTMKPLAVEPKSNPESATDSLGEDPTTAVPEAEEEQPESPEGDEPAAEGAETQEDDKGKTEPEPEREEYEIFLEGEEEDEPAPKDNAAWAKLRTEKAKADAEAARLKRELEAARQPAGPTDPGPEPTSEDPDIAYDEVKLKAALRKWDADKAAFDAHKAKVAEQQQAQNRELQSKVSAYDASMAELSKRVPGCAEAEKVVAASLSDDRKIVILKYAENPARVVSYLGRDPGRLDEFAKETDLGRFIAKLAKLEVSMKERKKTQAPPPEQTPRGSGAVTVADSTLAKLRAKAEQTGDYGPVNAYKRKLRAKRQQRQ